MTIGTVGAALVPLVGAGLACTSHVMETNAQKAIREERELRSQSASAANVEMARDGRRRDVSPISPLKSRIDLWWRRLLVRMAAEDKVFDIDMLVFVDE